jgi:signal transduction histidine kinase
MSNLESNPTSDVSRPRHEELRLLRAYVVALVIWVIPTGTCFLVGNVTLRQFAYGAILLSFLYGLALTIMAFAYRVASARGLSLRAAAAFSLVATVPALTISYLIDYAVVRWDPSLSPMPNLNLTILGTLAQSLADSLAHGTFLAAIVFLPVFARAHEERNHELRNLEREAELLRFRANLEPHFVLNSLHAVAGLVEEDPPQARELLAALGDLFRDATAFRSTHRVHDEVEWLKRYVTIHELRHPSNLQATWDLEPAALKVSCPALLLQPLVENAVKHGALRGGSTVAIRARLSHEHLTLSVEDDGPGLESPRAGGRGLEIIRRRLALEGLRRDAFELVREGHLTVARVRLPVPAEVVHA